MRAVNEACRFCRFWNFPGAIPYMSRSVVPDDVESDCMVGPPTIVTVNERASQFYPRKPAVGGCKSFELAAGFATIIAEQGTPT